MRCCSSPRAWLNRSCRQVERRPRDRDARRDAPAQVRLEHLARQVVRVEAVLPLLDEREVPQPVEEIVRVG